MPNYTQENARTRPVNDARSRGEKYRYFPGGLTKYGNDPTVNKRRSHPLRYLESPRGQPIRTRAEEELPGVIGGDAASPEKQPVLGERDSRVGQDKPTIKGRTSSETRLSYSFKYQF